MTTFLQALSTKFGEETLTVIDKVPNSEVVIVLIRGNFNRKFSLLSTCGLSTSKMPFRQEENNAPFVELCFALPDYWDFNFESPNSKWPIEKLKFLVSYALQKNVHFWDGHTMPNAKPNKPFSVSMKQNHLFLSKPLIYENEFSIVMLEQTEVHWLFLIPIFEKELEYKFTRGVNALKKKLVGAGHGEILDEFRPSAIKRMFGLF